MDNKMNSFKTWLLLALLFLASGSLLTTDAAEPPTGPLWCYYCQRNCDTNLGAAFQCPGQNQLCVTYYEDSNMKKITGRDCVSSFKGCFPVAGKKMACACREHFCNNRRFMRPFYEDRTDMYNPRTSN
jgi:hypothetical protein